MPRKPKVAEEEIVEGNEGLEELESFDPEGIEEPSELDLIKADVERLKSVWRKLVESLSTNQKYIRKNFENIKTLGDNFTILLDKVK